MPGLAYGGRHCDTSFIFVVDVMKQKEMPVKNYKMLEPARKLRREMTPQERKLWYAFLKDYPVKIYKQRIIESYIVDFYCAKLGWSSNWMALSTNTSKTSSTIQTVTNA